MLEKHPTSLVEPSREKISLPLKILAAVLIAIGVLSLPILVLSVAGVPFVLSDATQKYGGMTIALVAIELALMLSTAVLYVLLGVNMLRNRRRYARQAIEVTIVLTIAQFLCEMMLIGLSAFDIWILVRLAAAVALMVYIDPSLSQERELKRRLRDLETRERAEDGTLGRDETGKGYIELDFFNLFWIFVVASVLGLVIETVYHMVVVDPGVYQDRTGMLWGPFSPIYGIGAVLMTVALNRFHRANVLIVFFVSALIGGAFEYLVSWFLQFAFGIVAWDYTGTFLSIDGRTNGMFMAMWGVLGCFWIKLILPRLLKVVNMIPWQWRYSLTTVCAALMIFNAGMTLLALDCWYQREAGDPIQNAVEQFMAEHYGNEFMANHFQSMSIDPSNSTRAH